MDAKYLRRRTVRSDLGMVIATVRTMADRGCIRVREARHGAIQHRVSWGRRGETFRPLASEAAVRLSWCRVDSQGSAGVVPVLCCESPTDAL